MRKWLLGGTLLVLASLAAAWWLGGSHDRQDGEAPPPATPASTDPIQRGRELVTLADCRSCHTARGGAPFAGGREIPTPFGTFYSPNITPDQRTGLGSWSATDFWHALHNGYSKDGTLLYPTFPYTNYTRISRRDSDAMFAYLRSLAPVSRPNHAHELAFPYNHRLLLVAWRWLFFRPGVYEPEQGHSSDWNRGAYLVQGLGHCSACHEARNALGATRSKAGPSGGLVLDWYAPSLTSPQEAGVQGWTDADIVTLLKTGLVSTSSAKATASGPMAEVVSESLQQTPDDELRAMATYLKSLPVSAAPDAGASGGPNPEYEIPPAVLAAGEDLYTHNCADCHGDHGEGREPAAPSLAGNRAVTMTSVVNPIRMVLFGGYSPGTAGNPRPFGMPPYSLTMSDEQIAEVLIYVRSSWGNAARPVRGEEVGANRGSPLW
jgi:mono/diheme cytochrome c family protein